MIEEAVRYKPRKKRSKPIHRKLISKSAKRRETAVKRKVVSISKLKKKLDAVFSKFIREKYPKYCYTCNKPSAKLQCGHFVPRTYLATRWDENNCRPQCVGCNIFGRGQLLDFEENLKEELGSEVVEDLKRKRSLLWKLNAHWYETEIARYTQIVDKLLSKG